MQDVLHARIQYMMGEVSRDFCESVTHLVAGRRRQQEVPRRGQPQETNHDGGVGGGAVQSQQW